MSSFFGASTSTAAPQADKDIEVADPPPDSISSVAFSPQADYLAVGSWDNNVISHQKHSIFALCMPTNPLQLGSDLRGWHKWTDTREGDVSSPGSCVERLLEQGMTGRYAFGMCD